MHSHKKVLLFFSVLVSAYTHCFSQTNNSANFYLYEDSAKTLDVENAVLKYNQGKFTRPVSNQINKGFTRSVFWLAFENTKDYPGDSLLLYIGHHHINKIHFYYSANNNNSLQWITGDHFPFSQRPVNSTGFYFPINRKGIYIARIDKSNESLQLSFRLTSRSAALISESNNKTIMSLLSGMIILLVLFGIYLWIISKDLVYLYYVLYMVSGWLWVLANAGYGFQYIWPEQPWFASKARPVFALAPILFSIFFLEHFIGKTEKNNTRLILHIAKTIILFFIILILVLPEESHQSLLWEYLQNFLLAIPTLYMIVLFYVLIKASLNKNKLALFYLIGTITLFISLLLQVYFSLGGLNRFGIFFSHYGTSIGYVFELIILTAGLVYRFNQYKKEKERLLIELNKRQIENTRLLLDVQEAERSQIANQLHDVAGSLLSAAKLSLSSIRQNELILHEQTDTSLKNTEEAISMVSDMVRNLSHALSPVMIEKVGLKNSLEKIISIVNASGKMNIQSIVIGFEEYNPAFSKYYLALYGIMYELLNNIFKHSGATHVLFEIVAHDDSFTIMAEDNGIGIDEDSLEKNSSLGLMGIRSKVEYLNGQIVFDRNSPSGLIVTIEIPILNEKA